MFGRHLLLTLLPALLGLLACGSCSTGKAPATSASPAGHEEKNSVYWWRTVLDPDSVELEFLRRHDVRRAYVRFFDVVPVGNRPVPDASLTVKGSLPVEELVPTVFITQEAMKLMAGREREWAGKLVRRVLNMASYNELPEVREIQLDCDWTRTTQDGFFALCQAVGDSLRRFEPSALVSSTIRLHQLRGEAPPVDYGVLMLYNTGSFKNPDEDNSILSPVAVKPYLKYLTPYPLHLDIAYPTYEWVVIYDDGRFKGIMRDAPEELEEGETMRVENSESMTLREVKGLVEEQMRERPHSNVIYHLDSRNLSNYTSDEIKTLYR